MERQYSAIFIPHNHHDDQYMLVDVIPANLFYPIKAPISRISKSPEETFDMLLLPKGSLFEKAI